MNAMMKKAKHKALGELIIKMRKLEGKPFAGEEKPDEADQEEQAEDIIDPNHVMNEDDEAGEEEGDDFESMKKDFMKRGANHSPMHGKSKLMISIAMGAKPKMKK